MARVEVPGEFQLLAARGGVLYSDRGGPALTNIVRLDPGNGRLLAKSPQLLAVSGFVFDDGLLWALAGSGTPGRPGNAVLIGLDPRTLRKERSIGLPTSSVSPPVAAPGAEIWLVAGCHLLQVGLQPGKILRSFPLGPGGGCISRLAVDGDRLYVAGPQVATDRLLLQERLASDGQVVSQGIVPDAPLGVNVAAADGYLWAAGGPPGANGSLFLYRTSPLRLVGSTGTEGGNGPLPGGPQMRRLPGFGQFPDVNISGGTVWVGSDGQDACFAAGTAKSGSVGLPGPALVTGPVVVTASGTFAISNWQPGGGIVALKPPAGCSPRHIAKRPGARAPAKAGSSPSR